MKLPQKTESERSVREAKMSAATEEIIQVPFRLMTHINATWQTLEQMAAVGNMNCKSDLQVGDSRSFSLLGRDEGGASSGSWELGKASCVQA